MPSKNVPRLLVPNSYCHCYNRGWNKGSIFYDEDDYEFFERLLERYLSPRTQKDVKGRIYHNYFDQVHLNAYCLMGNHFHLLLRQFDDEMAIPQVMKSVLTAYTAYFNIKYNRRGPVFESTYKMVVMSDDSQFMHITRYIHLNHSNYFRWRHSSYGDYVNGVPRDWIDPRPVLELFSSVGSYKRFVADYEGTQRERDEIKRSLYGKS